MFQIYLPKTKYLQLKYIFCKDHFAYNFKYPTTIISSIVSKPSKNEAFASQIAALLKYDLRSSAAYFKTSDDLNSQPVDGQLSSFMLLYKQPTAPLSAMLAIGQSVNSSQKNKSLELTRRSHSDQAHVTPLFIQPFAMSCLSVDCHGFGAVFQLSIILAVGGICAIIAKFAIYC